MQTSLAGMFSLEGRRALVTGGSVSIGHAITAVLADAGADITIQFALPEPAAKLADQPLAGHLFAIPVDVPGLPEPECPLGGRQA